MDKLIVLTDLSNLPAEIHSNYDTVKAQLIEALQKYDGLVVTDENFKEMKKTRAEINSGIEVIKEVGTDVKRKLLAPFAPFDAKVKELVSLATEKRDALDGQIKEIEVKRRAEKEEELKRHVQTALAAREWPSDAFLKNAFFDGLVPAHREWMNATFSLAKGKAEIESIVERCHEALAQVERIYASDTEVVRTKAGMALIDTGFDVGRTCERINAFKEEEARLAEARRRDEEARRAREAAAAVPPPQEPPAATPVPASAPVAQDPMEAAKAALRAAREASADSAQATPPPPLQPAPQPSVAKPADLKPAVYVMGLSVQATCAQLHALKNFLLEKAIPYEVTSGPDKVVG